MELIADGLSNQDIAEKLFISVNTARNHIYNIYRKMGIKNRYELINLVTNVYFHRGALIELRPSDK